MPLSRSQKEKMLSEYQDGVAQAPHAFILGYQGIDVPRVTELRRRVRDSGGQYLVVKNTLMLRAIAGKPLAGLEEHFVGPTAVVYADDEPVALAKALTDFQKEAPVIEFRGGLLNGQMVGADQIKDIANLPSREELITKLVYMLQSPIVRFVRALGAIPQQFVSVLDQVRQQKESEG